MSLANWRELQPLMAQMVVLDVKHSYAGGETEYTAMSDLFRPVQDGECIPDYDFEFTRSLQSPGPIEMKAIEVRGRPAL